MTPLRELREITRDYLQHQDLLWQLVLRDLRVRYAQAAMGFLWALFMPAMLVLAGTILRSAMAAPAQSGPELGAVALRGLLWSSFAAALAFGTGSLVANATLVSKVYFPREVLPVAAVLSNLVDAAVGGVVLTLALPWLGGKLTLALLWVPLLLVLLLMLTVALALVLSAANLFYRDVKYIVQALLSVGVFFTPVFFSPAELGPTGARLLPFNPLTALLEGARLSVLSGHNLALPLLTDVPGRGVVLAWSPWMLAYSAGWAVAGLLLASLLFHHAEGDFAERV